MVSNDELGILTQSFNRMTFQLREAHTETERHRADLERARAYLQEVLDNLSAGVLAFDRRFVLKAVNGAAKTLLAEDWVGLISEPLEAWPRQETGPHYSGWFCPAWRCVLATGGRTRIARWS